MTSRWPCVAPACVKSRALRRQAKSALFPQVSAGGGYARAGLSENTGDGNGQAIRAGIVAVAVTALAE